MSNRTFFCLTALLITIAGTARAEIRPNFLMDVDPDRVLVPPLKNSMERHKELWIQTLGRPEIDLQRMSAESIAVAHTSGVADFSDAVPALERILQAESTHPAARFSAARALVVIDSRTSADALFQASQKYGADLRQLIEPALAEWNFGPIKEIWIKRLEAPNNRTRDFMLAVRGIAQVHETSALPALRAIVLNLVLVSDIRLEAATAAGILAETGLEEDSDRLIRETRTSPIVNRHCAIRLLARHSSEVTRRLLGELAVDPEPSLTSAALKRLNEIDPLLVLPFAEAGLQNRDAHVRTQAARAYVTLPTTERIAALSRLLDDPHPGIRGNVCGELSHLAETPELNEVVRSSATEMLNGKGWRGQEQASLLLGELVHQPAGKRLLELLESDRNEVMVASAWALRKIADPTTIPAIIDKISRQTAARKLDFKEKLDLQVAHLFEACGQLRAKEAESLMLEYVPKDLIMGERSRGAAIWALGWIHEKVPNASLGGALIERINDISMMPPESSLVKEQSIIAIGRMKAVDYAAQFRVPLEKGTPNDTMSLALRWAVKELTGEEFPEPEAIMPGPGTWFLDPIVLPKSE